MLTLARPAPLPLAPALRADFDVAANGCPDGGTPVAGRPDARALDRFGIETALRLQVLPMEPAGAIRPVACTSERAFRRLKPDLQAAFGPVICRVKPARAIEAEILRLRAPVLARRAEVSAPFEHSCRNWRGKKLAAVVLLVLAGLLVIAALWPAALVVALTIWTVVTLVSVTALRATGALAAFRIARRRAGLWRSRRPNQIANRDLPRISLLVPLFDELDIAGRLVGRLGRLDYPRDKLEVVLILEDGDLRTEAALRHASLPPWMRIVHVPRGPIRTKPRAMNYALDFTGGEIVGIYDAEDAPAANQLKKVAESFAASGPEVACFQGILDFYNAPQSWLTRCFTIDYAAWFRLILPGLERLGLVIPLGGTTVFFRRDALEDLGRWDAHNVTEDADLGLRLARQGYRCAFMQSVTEEEATSHIRAWLKQRSRWIKGYAVTWAVHMRDPLQLLGDLGVVRFLGVQILFLGTLSHFLLAPFLWSFWLIVFGVPHPVAEVFSAPAVLAIASLFFFSEVVTMLVAAAGVATPKHAWLIKWVPVMHLYFPLAAIASWKGFFELVSRPFYWDKTAHGTPKVTRRLASLSARLRRRPGAGGLRTPG